MDQMELLNQIINHKMLQKMLEAECDTSRTDFHVFTRMQLHEINHARLNLVPDLLLKAINIQIAQEEEMFKFTNTE